MVNFPETAAGINNVYMLLLLVKIYLQIECIEKCKFKLCSNMIENMILTSYSDKSYVVVS